MNKNSILVTIIFVLFGLILLSGCKALIINDNFAVYNIGDHFAENRDGYFIKLNDSFFANITYKNKYVEIHKLLDTTSSDIIGNTELYYSDDISKCYCKDSSIIVYSLTTNCYVFIDCNDINNTQTITEIDDANINLSEFTEVNLYDD